MNHDLWKATVELGVDLSRAVEEAFGSGRLSMWQRLVLYLHYFAGMTFDEIAEHASLPEWTVRRDHKRALEALRESPALRAYGELE
jgi:RNA polymerase sigma factor (sigma-70 family)